MGYPDFSSGEVLTSSDMDRVGLWRITRVTIGNAVSSVAVSNCFSSNFDNYRLILSDATVSVGGSIGLQLNNATGSSYYMGGIYMTFTSATINGYGPAANTRWNDVWAAETVQSTGALDLFSPNKAKPTTGTCMSVKAGSGGATLAHYSLNMLENTTSQHTGFTLYPVSGTMTGGTITVYGYNSLT